MIRSIVLALAASFLLHGLLAVGLVACLGRAHDPDARATLELSSVEFSFADEIDDSAAVAPQPPSPPVERKPPEETVPPDPPVALPLPPDPAAPTFRTPKEDVCPIETPSPSEEARKDREQRIASMPEATPAVAPRQAKVDAPPRPSRPIRPDYPKGARQRGEQGDVTLEVGVDAQGVVDAVSVVSSSGYPELDEAAVKTVRAAKFSPARSDAAAVASRARLTLRFKLR